MHRYLARFLATIDAPDCEYLAGVALPFWGNDEYGDCTCATAATLLASWTHAATGAPVVLPDAAVLDAYGAITGFRADDPSTDNGAAEPDVIRYLTATGIGGHRIDAHAFVDPTRRDLLRAAIWLFGGVSADLALPKNIDEQTARGAWEIAGDPTGDLAPGADGYHEVAIVGATAAGWIVRTWSTRVTVTPAWLAAYCTGAWALRSHDFLQASGVPANGVDLASWDADLARVGDINR